MGWALRQQEYRSFTLHIRCENCMRDTERGVSVPACGQMPLDADDFLESALLDNMSFHCHHCHGVIGRLFGISEGE